MVIGPFINGAAILAGGIVGAMLGHRLPERVRLALPMTFGITSMGMGVVLIGKVAHMPVMVLALVLGALLGELCYIERGISRIAGWARNLMAPKGAVREDQKEFLEAYVAIIVLFCASGTGIFGSMHEGMTGDASVLIAKSFLDLFTALIFASTLGLAVALIAVPQLVIQLALAFGAVLILPLTTPAMQADFSAVGGLMMLATGLRICGIKLFPVANMLPALVLAMPISAAWIMFF
ncbi:TPA: DUF554 domain-containing protein [Serratia fonticola]